MDTVTGWRFEVVRFYRTGVDATSVYPRSGDRRFYTWREVYGRTRGLERGR